MKTIKIATRSSKLALAQTQLVIEAMRKINPAIRTELVKVKTKADRILHKELASIGGKALFTKEIDKLVLNGQADLAVHSAKDIETNLDPDLQISAYLERADVNDCIITRFDNVIDIKKIPAGSKIGTSSPRRKAQLLALNPQIKLLPMRGNINTRLNKLKAGNYDAIILAKAGLERLNIQNFNIQPIDLQLLLPSSGQGAIAIVTNKKSKLRNLLERINHTQTNIQVSFERAVLDGFQGDCHTPIAVQCKLEKNIANILAEVYSSNGSKKSALTRSFNIQNGQKEAYEMGRTLREKAKNFLCQKYC